MSTLLGKMIVTSIAGITVLSSGGVLAVSTDSTISANIVAPIVVSDTQGMSFGDIIAGSVPSTVVLATSGERTVSNGNASLGATGGTPATLSITGEPAALFTLTLPTTPVILTSGAATMSTNNFTNDSTGVLDAAGTETVNISATLSVSANQPVGSYFGTFVIEAVY